MSARPTSRLEPPQVVYIDTYNVAGTAYISFSYKGSQAAAAAAIQAAYPSAKVWPNERHIVSEMYLEALGDTLVGDYVGEKPERQVYYRRKAAKRKAGTEALRRLRNL